MSKHTLPVVDSKGNKTTLEVTVIEDESELHAIEEPPEPIITATFDGGCWIVYGDENASHPDFEEKWWPVVLYGGNKYADEAKDYARRWARAVRGTWEEV